MVARVACGCGLANVMAAITLAPLEVSAQCGVTGADPRDGAGQGSSTGYTHRDPSDGPGRTDSDPSDGPGRGRR